MQIAEGDRSGVRLFPPLVYAVAIAAAILIHRLFPLHIVPTEHAGKLRIAGAALLAGWLALAAWAIATFRRIGTTANPAGGSTALALEGPYRFTRNPMYLSLVLLKAGIGLVANMLWPLILLPPVMLVIARNVIGPEERYLEAKFGEPYRRYRARVRRWI